MTSVMIWVLKEKIVDYYFEKSIAPNQNFHTVMKVYVSIYSTVTTDTGKGLEDYEVSGGTNPHPL